MPVRPTAPFIGSRDSARGQVLVLFTLVLVVLLLCSALAVDYGSWLVTRRSYQNVADAAALAGAQQLTRPLSDSCASGASKNECAREAAWQSVKSALGLTALDAAALAAGPDFTNPYVEKGYSIWVASPPAQANVGCSSNCPYPGHVSGPGVVFVRVEHAGPHYLSRVAFSSDTPVTAWAAAGRFPNNFAVIGMCDPNTGGGNCIVQGANIKIDGNNSLLAVATGDLGTNSWTRTSGSGSAVGLGPDSNAYMGTFEDCWNAGGNQCNLYTYSGGAVDYSSPRSAVPLGAAIQNPAYPAPTITQTTTPYQCYLYANRPGVVLASVPTDVPDVSTDALPVAAVGPLPADPVTLAATTTATGQVKNYWTGAGVNGLTVTFAGLGSSVTSGSGNNAGTYSIANATKGQTYQVTISSGATTILGPLSVTVPNSGKIPDITIQPYATVDGYVRSQATNAPLVGATVTIAAGGGANTAPAHTTTTDSSGHYVIANVEAFDRSVTASAGGYDPATKTVTVAIVSGATSPATDFSLSVGGTVNGTVLDATTNLGISGVTVTASKSGSPTQTATSNGSGGFTFTGLSAGTWTVSAAAVSPYLAISPATFSTSAVVVSGSTTAVTLSLWPQHCDPGGGAGNGTGDWKCSVGPNCPATQNLNGADVTCAFTPANAIRPGTYHDIIIDGCAWIDPKGGTTGLASGQSAGMIHVTGQLKMLNNSYLFGDGVTIVFDQGTNLDVQNGGGFVLNYGSLHNTPANPASGCNLSSAKQYGDGYSPCFRTVDDGQDYAYAAWTSKGHSPWACGTTYSDSCGGLTKGVDLGITFYLFGSGKGNASRFKISTANMGYLFNGVLYGPSDDIQLGGGKDGQTSAGQIVGWTIEYHGGTKIIQNWYADPTDGAPFLIEPILGECVLPVGVCS